MRETTIVPTLRWSRAFAATPARAREARKFLATILEGERAADDAVLCLSELVTNASIHSRSREPGGIFTMRAHLNGEQLRVEVCDQGGPWAGHPRADGQHGRGLLIVAQLASNWGRTGDSETGWTVWFEMDGS